MFDPCFGFQKSSFTRPTNYSGQANNAIKVQDALTRCPANCPGLPDFGVAPMSEQKAKRLSQARGFVVKSNRKTQFRLNIGREPTLRHGDAPRCRNPSRAVPSRAIRALQSTILPTSRPDQHGGSFDQPPGTAQQAVGATISRIYDPRACSFV
ncbi:unnamed protein product [Nesidiocoris tenuis]|uniref:Uncharacterized protein n=1 Tax=Nesidiocoris tenuis TaxID=355587 RepID=A0A6H5HBK8_9HEMI|nr:unnamed protein product [Nesidiocoris tenuis]